MKRDETQAYALDIRRQRTARKIQPMNTPSLPLKLLTALLLCAGAAQAAEPQAAPSRRPLDLSVPRDAKALPVWRKPYGSGYESRGLSQHTDTAVDATPAPSDPAAGNSQGGGAGGGGSGAGGGAGGAGGSGGRGR